MTHLINQAQKSTPLSILTLFFVYLWVLGLAKALETFVEIIIRWMKICKDSLKNKFANVGNDDVISIKMGAIYFTNASKIIYVLILHECLLYICLMRYFLSIGMTNSEG